MPVKNKAVSLNAVHAPAAARDADATRSTRNHGPRRSLTIAVLVRQPTLDDERRFDAAFDLLLSELVRQRLGRDGEEYEQHQTELEGELVREDPPLGG